MKSEKVVGIWIKSITSLTTALDNVVVIKLVTSNRDFLLPTGDTFKL